MAVIVDLNVPDATTEQVYAVEELTRQRGEAMGGPPFSGCMFLAVTAAGSGFRIVSAWRTEADFRSVFDAMIAPDLASVGLAATDVQVAPALSMAIPGTQAP